MNLYEISIAIVLAYLLGAIPTSVWTGRIFYGIDIRKYGSGNAGATNTMRVLGPKAGIPVLIFDVFKGWAAVKLGFVFGGYMMTESNYMLFMLVLGVAATIGHIFPVYVGFRGGKGVATLLGVALGVHTGAALIVMGIFLFTLLVSSYVSFSSIIAGFSFPIAIVFIFKNNIIPLTIFSILVSVLLLITHQKNLDRLIRRQESKAKLFKRRKKMPL